MKFSPLQISHKRFIVIEKNAMRPLKLHIKTSLLASLITVLMFVVALAFVSVKIASLLQEKEKDLTCLENEYKNLLSLRVMLEKGRTP